MGQRSKGQTSTNNIQLENSTTGEFETETIVLDGHAPLNEGEVPILLEGDEDLDHIILETGSNILMEDGYRVLNEDQGFVSSGLKDRLLLERGGIVMAESDRFSFPLGFVVDENENLILEGVMAAQKDFNIKSTPSFVINGNLVEGNKNIKEFRQIIDKILSE